jgi:hypothetical protein
VRRAILGSLPVAALLVVLSPSVAEPLEDSDWDLIPDEIDCDDQNQYCGLDCTDADADGVCVDHDCDGGVADCNLRCGTSDVDGDSIVDACDNRPLDFNADQSDIDQDGAGDVCDVCPQDPRYRLASMSPLYSFDGICNRHLDASPLGNVYVGCSSVAKAFTREGSYLGQVAVDGQQLNRPAVGPGERFHIPGAFSGPVQGAAFYVTG